MLWCGRLGSLGQVFSRLHLLLLGQMTRDQLLRLVSNIRTGKWRGTRAPHKPLLLLLALGRVASGRERLVSYADVDERLAKLLREFGPPRIATHPEFPFGRLRTDDLWDIPGDSELSLTASGDLKPKEMRERGVRGGFPEEVHALLRSDRQLLTGIAHGLLVTHFPPSLHDDIRDAVGLPREWGFPRTDAVPWSRQAQKVRESRDATFRERVLREYRHRCAVCDHDIRLNEEVFGLEAAHIRWHSHDGPDTVANGLALCVLHHKALDRGALGLEESRGNTRVLVSRHVGGTSRSANLLVGLHGKPLRRPLTQNRAPSPVFVGWHRREVFRAPPRTEG